MLVEADVIPDVKVGRIYYRPAKDGGMADKARHPIKIRERILIKNCERCRERVV
jgi:hypothetical protein